MRKTHKIPNIKNNFAHIVRVLIFIIGLNGLSSENRFFIHVTTFEIVSIQATVISVSRASEKAGGFFIYL